MTNPLDALNVGQLKTEVEAALASAQQLIAFAEKFSFLLPPTAKASLPELQTVLNVVQSLLSHL